MSNIDRVPEELLVGRGDPAYMAHAYLTKVPVPAIIPFIEANTSPGDVVVDPFAGSGMTGVAAAMVGRTARLFDISVLGRHIGRNYVNLVEPRLLTKQADEAVSMSRQNVDDLYRATCQSCGKDGELAKSVWSVIVECSGCGSAVNYYRALEAANWRKGAMNCEDCAAPVSSRNRRMGEEAVVDYINCACSSYQLEQPAQAAPKVDLQKLDYPKVDITPDRQMYQASALAKNGLTTVAAFYSSRNLTVLTSLHKQISSVQDEALRSKLLFAFTGCLTRASKRYQWSKARPLNAANANYYVAPVFYEWNVYELFLRKVNACVRSDDWIQATRRLYVSPDQWENPDVTYQISSAEKIPLPDDSVDYVFTDPPFGSNLFYADMALFQEAWLGCFTDERLEAVIDRSSSGTRSAERYERLLTQALGECRRILKPGGKISMVFGNSSGRLWALVQRSVAAAGLLILPDELVVLNKGQRSVKGLASGFEDVATLDLIITMEPHHGLPEDLQHLSDDIVSSRIRDLAAANPATPSHLYLELLRCGIREGWRLDELDLRTVTGSLIRDGWTIDPKSGRLCRDQDETGCALSTS